MTKKTLFTLIILCLLARLNLSAEAEYDIVLMAPEGQELTSSYGWAPSMNEARYVGGSLKMDRNANFTVPFVFTPEKGFQLIYLPTEMSNGSIASINKHGLAVGIYKKRPTGDNWYYDEDDEKLFVYNIHDESLFDLYEHLNLPDPSILLDPVKIRKLFITDNNLIVVSLSKSSYYYEEPPMTFVFDLQKKTATYLAVKGLVAANAQGQAIGYEEIDYPPKNSWFFDSKTGHQELGSLDKFNRWPVNPETLSPNGTVAGKGLDSHGDEKAFSWSHELGLHQIDIAADWISINAVNDQGYVTGHFAQDYDGDDPYHEISFLYHPTTGLIDLGTLEIGRESRPRAINNSMQIVGKAEINDYGRERAFIWDAEHGMRDLTTLIPQDTGWKVLKDAEAINDAGCILGRGFYYGVEHYFLLIPKL